MTFNAQEVCQVWNIKDSATPPQDQYDEVIIPLFKFQLDTNTKDVFQLPKGLMGVCDCNSASVLLISAHLTPLINLLNSTHHKPAMTALQWTTNAQ